MSNVNSYSSESVTMKDFITFFFIISFGCSLITFVESASDECSLTPVIHVLQYPGCV